MKKIKLTVFSILNIIPFLIAAIFYSKLPNKLPIHWNIEGVADGFASKPIALLFIPAIILMLNIIIYFVIKIDPKGKENMRNKIVHIIFFFIPVLAIIIQTFTVISGLGYNPPVTTIIFCLIGILFIIIGNYLPTCNQSYTVGIRTPWTLDNKEVWDKTHELGGKLFIAFGIISIITLFLPLNIYFIIYMVSMALMLFVPIIYSAIIFYKTKR